MKHMDVLFLGVAFAAACGGATGGTTGTGSSTGTAGTTGTVSTSGAGTSSQSATGATGTSSATTGPMSTASSTGTVTSGATSTGGSGSTSSTANDNTTGSTGSACYPLFHSCSTDTQCCTPYRCLNITGTPACQLEGPVATDAGVPSDASSSCSDLTTLAACEARVDCHSVFVDPGTCDCAALGCCASFSRCADGDQAACKGTPLCKIVAPHCEGPYVISYTSACYEGCVAMKDCAP